jgi:murein DD-endopeptidase MepM/ murein hydrolase activator NlpD
MNNFYYFSKQKLKFVEVKNFKAKFVSIILIAAIVISAIAISGYYIINSFITSDAHLASLESDNKELTTKFKELLSLYNSINSQIDSLTTLNNQLRIAANLPPISSDERLLGTGGGNTNFFNFSSKKFSEIDLNEINKYVDKIENKIHFEKSNYTEISKTLKENEKLFASIPALKPCDGVFSEHGFGMRMHPILRIVRMHEGVDIITSMGTPVHAPGNGFISFVGYKGGFGLCIEIDHGFGYKTIYGHLSSTSVNIGQQVKRGQLIAATGNSGLSSGPHLHYEVQHDGIKLDPMNFIFDDLAIFDLKNLN